MVPGCGAADSPDPPERAVAVHGLVWNGRAPGTLNDYGQLTVHLFDHHVGCEVLPRGAIGPALPGVSLEVTASPALWTKGEEVAFVHPRLLEASGREARFRHDSRRAEPLVLRSAPKTAGSFARAHVDARIEIGRRDEAGGWAVERVDVMEGDVDLEICGDIVWPPEPLRTP